MFLENVILKYRINRLLMAWNVISNGLKPFEYWGGELDIGVMCPVNGCGVFQMKIHGKKGRGRRENYLSRQTFEQFLGDLKAEEVGLPWY